MGVISELKRRNVLRMAALYIVAAWLVMQVAEVLIGLGVLPESIGLWVTIVLAIGFPIALAVSWIFELTPEGVALDQDAPVRVSPTPFGGRRTDFVIIAILSAGLLFFAYDKWWIGPPPERSVAVLAFENMSSDPEQEFFSDGISDDIINRLAEIEPLKVIARHSSFAFKGKDDDIASIAEQLNVRHIVEGSVRRSGNKIRITAQLIDGKDSSNLWSQTFDRVYSAENLFSIQSEIARAITDRLRATLTDEDENRLAVVPTENTEAYAAYLIGRERLRDRKVGELRDAVGQFARAIELDPQFARAYVGLADACLLFFQYSNGELDQHCPFAGDEKVFSEQVDVELLVQKALSIDNEVGEAWVTLGRFRQIQAVHKGGGPDTMGLIREAQAAFKKGIDLNPSFSQAYDWYARSLLYIYSYDDPPNGWLTAWESGHWQSVIERGLAVDPLSLGLHGSMTNYPMYASTPDKAVAHAQKMIEIAPDSPLGYASMANIQAEVYGRLDKAIPWWKRAVERDSENSYYWHAIAESYCALGDAGMATAYVQQAEQLLPAEWTGGSRALIIEACELLLSGDVYSGRLEEALGEIDGEGSLSYLAYLELRAMIDIAAGRAKDALAKYKAHYPEHCFEDSDDDLGLCHYQVMRVMQAAGDRERARKFAETRLKFMKPWFDRYPAYWTSLQYAQGLAVLGRADDALDVLEALYASGWRGLGWTGTWFTLEYDIAFDAIRDRPRFQMLIAAIRADLARQLENVRAMERKGELRTLQEVQAGLVVNSN